MKTVFVLIFYFFLMTIESVGNIVTRQEPDTLDQLVRADSLDPLPEWSGYKSLVRLTIEHLCRDPRFDGPRFISDKNPGPTSSEYSKLVLERNLKYFEAVHLLAWQRVARRTCSDSSDTLASIYSSDLALFLGHYWSFYDQQEQWGLVLLERSNVRDSIGEWSPAELREWLSRSVYGIQGHYRMGVMPSDIFESVHRWDWFPIQMFDRPPTNAEIYSFLDRARTKSKFRLWSFREDESLSEEHRGTTRAICSQFIDCDVRERTWEAVVGEKPERFFPGSR